MYYNSHTDNARYKKLQCKQTTEDFCERLNSTRLGLDIDESPSADLHMIASYFFNSSGVKMISLGGISLNPNALTAFILISIRASLIGV